MNETPEIVKILREEERNNKLKLLNANNCDYLQLDKKEHVDKDKKQNDEIYNVNKKSDTQSCGLKNMGEIYKTIFENSAVAITVTDENENIISWNKYAEELLNMNYDDLYMAPIKSLYSPKEWQKIRSENVRQKGMQHHLETKILRKNKDPLDVDISLSVLKDNNGNIIGSIGVIKDISYQKQTEQRLKSLMEHANDSIYLVDKDCRYLLVNNELLIRLGLSESQIIGRSFSKFHSEKETEDFSERIKSVFKNGKTLIDEHKSERLDKWFLRTLSPVKDSVTGKVIAVAIISKDITDWKKTEKMLKISEEKYRTIFDNSAVAIMLTDENEKIISWNKYAEKLFCMKKSDLYMKPVASLYPSDEWKKIRSENVRKKGMQHRLETKIIKKNSEILDVDISISVLKDNDGKIVGSIGVIKDISERKRAEEERRKKTEELDAMNRLSIAINKELKLTQQKLKELNDDLEKKVEKRTGHIKELLKQKDDFIGQLGHDLKTPISILTNILPMIKHDIDNSELKQDCEMAIRNVNYIKNLVEETLKIAELSSPNVRFDLRDISLLDLVKGVIKDNQVVFDKYNIKINNFIKPRLIVKADELRLIEIFNNLISNAVKYSNKDSGIITIDVEEDQDFATVKISDNGIGMTKEQKKHIFDDFYKVDESRHSLGSSGLGLSICKRIIEKHDGKIWVESPGEGKGATFYFTLRKN